MGACGIAGLSRTNLSNKVVATAAELSLIRVAAGVHADHTPAQPSCQHWRCM